MVISSRISPQKVKNILSSLIQQGAERIFGIRIALPFSFSTYHGKVLLFPNISQK